MPALAQQDRRVRRIGFFARSSQQVNTARLGAFRQGMAELRWVEGRDYVIEARYAEGAASAATALIAEVLATQPDLMLTPADEAVRLIMQRTKTIPIVFTASQDPVGSGLVASLRQPGGNVTGLTTLSGELSGKRLQLLKEAIPRITHVAVLREPGNVGIPAQVREIEAAGARLGIKISSFEVKQAADVDAAFKRGAALGAQGYILTQGGTLLFHRQAILERCLRDRIPAMFPAEEFADAGGLLSYAASVRNNFRRAAGYVDKIFKGAKPGELPIEQPTNYELVVNLKTARAMGFTFPKAFLARADRIIE